MTRLQHGVRSMTWAATALGMLTLTGCAGFFVNETATSGTTTATSGDYAYIVNNTTNTLSEYSVGSAALAAISGTPITLLSGLSAISVAVTRPNTFVYVGGNGAITCYSIGTGGVLSAVSGGGGEATANFVSLETSPDGQWLLALDTETQTVYVYAINTATGALTLNSSTQYASPSGNTVVPRQIRIAPSGAFVAIALGTAGDVLFTFNTSTGVLTLGPTGLYAAGYSDNALLFDANSAYLYVARGTTGTGTSGIASYQVSSTGVLTPVQALAASGSAPYSLVFDSTGGYLYAANRGDGTISGYTVSSGNLTALASSPYVSGLAVTALALDNSGSFLIAVASGGSSDATLYKQDALTAGQLDALSTAVSGTDPAGSIAVATTH
jgi:6-phosphogluconolactonase